MRTLNKPGAQIEIACGIGDESNFESARAALSESVQTFSDECSRQSSSLELIFNAHRLKKSDQCRGIEPVERVAGSSPVTIFDGEIEPRVIERTLAKSLLHGGAVARDHGLRRTSPR